MSAPPSPRPELAPVLALVPDIFFSTKIVEVARHVGVTVRVVPRVADIGAAYAACGALAPGVALVDMTSLGAETATAVAALRAAGGAALRIVAFGSHVDADAFAAARAAGADAVLPRSKFVATLPQVLRSET